MAGLLFLASLPFIVLGAHIAVNTDWQPMHTLDSMEVARIEAASRFVERHFTQHGRMPTTDDFQLWAGSAPSELRLDGVGFSYAPPTGAVVREYAFSFWEGDAWVTWRSKFTGMSVAEISPATYFFTGSKLFDLLVFFDIGVAALFAAKVVAPA